MPLVARAAPGSWLSGAVAVALLGCASVPPGVRVFVDAPRVVRVGEQFEIVARVENLSSEAITLVDLDIADSYLEGIAIDSTRPRFRELIHVPIDNTMSYTFDAEIDVDGELGIVIQATAEREGRFSGDFDFCINTMYSCLWFHVRTQVEP